MTESDLSENPVAEFQRWFDFARRVGLHQPNAFSLSTVGPDGAPSSRMLLLKGIAPDGFAFFTNYESRKGAELEANPRAAMLFFWSELHRQVRIEGRVERMADEESARYFATRPRGSRIGAWASRQSRPLSGRDELAREVKDIEQRFAGSDVPLPPFWGGYRLRPQRFEFWQGRADRLHDRIVFERAGDAWRKFRLSP